MEFLDIFSGRLSELLIDQNVSAYKLAKEIGKSKVAISQFINKKAYPHVLTLIALADFFDVSLDYLVGRSDTKERLP